MHVFLCACLCILQTNEEEELGAVCGCSEEGVNGKHLVSLTYIYGRGIITPRGFVVKLTELNSFLFLSCKSDNQCEGLT